MIQVNKTNLLAAVKEVRQLVKPKSRLVLIWAAGRGFVVGGGQWGETTPWGNVFAELPADSNDVFDETGGVLIESTDYLEGFDSYVEINPKDGSNPNLPRLNPNPLLLQRCVKRPEPRAVNPLSLPSIMPLVSQSIRFTETTNVLRPSMLNHFRITEAGNLIATDSKRLIQIRDFAAAGEEMAIPSSLMKKLIPKIKRKACENLGLFGDDKIIGLTYTYNGIEVSAVANKEEPYFPDVDSVLGISDDHAVIELTDLKQTIKTLETWIKSQKGSMGSEGYRHASAHITAKDGETVLSLAKAIGDTINPTGYEAEQPTTIGKADGEFVGQFNLEFLRDMLRAALAGNHPYLKAQDTMGPQLICLAPLADIALMGMRRYGFNGKQLY